MILSDIRDINLRFKAARASKDIRSRLVQICKEHPLINAITVCFTDIEGRLHLLDYDKDFLLSLSSISGMPQGVQIGENHLLFL